MQQILLQIDDDLAKQLERAAPAKSRGRSRFIRLAIQKALMDLQDASTRAAYEKQPQEPVRFDASVWGSWAPAARPKRRKK